MKRFVRVPRPRNIAGSVFSSGTTNLSNKCFKPLSSFPTHDTLKDLREAIRFLFGNVPLVGSKKTNHIVARVLSSKARWVSKLSFRVNILLSRSGQRGNTTRRNTFHAYKEEITFRRRVKAILFSLFFSGTNFLSPLVRTIKLQGAFKAVERHFHRCKWDWTKEKKRSAMIVQVFDPLFNESPLP